MDLPSNSLKVTIPVKAPVSLKPEKEEREEEDGFTTPKGEEFRIPPLLECPPAPGPCIYRKKIDKRRIKSVRQRITYFSPVSDGLLETPASPVLAQRRTCFNVKDLDTFVSRTHEVGEDS